MVLTSVVAMVAAASCSGDDAPYAVDGGELDGQVGADAGILDATVSDVSLDAPRDTSAPRDATDDGPNDATVDAEAGLDASLEGGADASADASDASLDAADAAPEIDIYDPALVPQFELTLDAAALAILSNPSTVEADRKAWAHGTLRYGGEVYPDIGVRRVLIADYWIVRRKKRLLHVPRAPPEGRVQAPLRQVRRAEISRAS